MCLKSVQQFGSVLTLSLIASLLGFGSSMCFVGTELDSMDSSLMATQSPVCVPAGKTATELTNELWPINVCSGGTIFWMALISSLPFTSTRYMKLDTLMISVVNWAPEFTPRWWSMYKLKTVLGTSRIALTRCPWASFFSTAWS